MSTYTFCPLCATPLELKTREGVERPHCPLCDFVHYDNPLPVVAAIVQRGEDVILVQNLGWPAHWFGLVSGFLERTDSSPEAAIVREVQEELGLECELSGLVGVYPFAQMNQVILAYHVTVWGEPVPNPLEIGQIKVVPIRKLKPWPFGTGAAVKDWLASYGA